MSPQRVDPRLVVGLDASYRVEGTTDWQAAVIHDLSASGAALVTAAPIPLQTLLAIRFTLPAGARDPVTELVIEAMGVRKAVNPDLTSRMQHLQGLYFLDLRGDRYERLRRYLWERSGGSL